MKKVIVPIINILFFIIGFFIVIPIYLISISVWNFKFPKVKLGLLYKDLFVDWKDNLRDIFSDKFLFED